MSRLLASGGQSTGASASASVVPMNMQSWRLLEQEGTWYLCDSDYLHFAQWLLSSFPVVLKCNHCELYNPVCQQDKMGTNLRWGRQPFFCGWGLESKGGHLTDFSCREQELHPWQMVMRKEARHTQRRDWASGVPLEILKHLPPKPESAYFLFCALTFTSDFMGGCPPLPLSEKS